jgi:hypothetical protein
MEKEVVTVRKILEKCPTCGEELEITRLSCTSCETVIHGRYTPCVFCKLSPESLRFLEIFVKNRGNIKEMERELGLSYPTVRGKLNAVINELGFEVEAVEEEDIGIRRREILDRLDRGEIKPSEATEMLSQLKR